MDKSLSKKQIILVASTIFGMVFGAGNLIFPVHLGQVSGNTIVPSGIGFIVTAVGIPIFAIMSIGYSKCNGLFELASKVSKKFAYFFTVLLYLTVSPLFVCPRSSVISFNAGLQNIIGDSMDLQICFLIFTILFFSIIGFFCFRPNQITTWIGWIINPAFLVFLSLLLLFALSNPAGSVWDIAPADEFGAAPFFNGFLQGYQTMDVLSGLCFGIIIIDVVKNMNIKSHKEITKNLIKPSIIVAILMSIIYMLTIIMGAQSCGIFDVSSNGSIALSQISNHYFGIFGDIAMFLIVSFASIKTCIGLITSASKAFSEMFPKTFNYNIWALIFLIVSASVSLLSLDLIIDYAQAVLAFVCPVSIILIALAFTSRLYNNSKIVYQSTILFTCIAGALDFLRTLPKSQLQIFGLDEILNSIFQFVPFIDIGFGWLIPALIGFTIGIIIYRRQQKQIKRA